MAARHLYDPATGGFSRHDDARREHAFIEPGGILCESLAWLFRRTGDPDLLDTALRIARYSLSHRDTGTGLVPNEPDMGRWDAKVSTSEIGLWAQCLLRAERHTGNGEFLAMARQAVRAYLQHAYDPRTGRFHGQLGLRDGRPATPEAPGYWPRQYADPWNTDQWATHDCPLAAAEACLELHERTGDDAFLDAARSWARVLVAYRPQRAAEWACADSYGRGVHFLTRAGLQLAEPRVVADAGVLAEEAVAALWKDGMFQGYPAAGVYEAVDGVGVLLLALLFLQSRGASGRQGFGF